jgi:zinc transport system ATP-binding protein
LIGKEPLYTGKGSWRDEEFGSIPAIDFQSVNVGHPNDSILQYIDLTIREKDCFGIIGPLGGGKTTLLRLALGLFTPSSGTVRVFGDKPTARLRRRLPVGYLPQFSPIPEDTPATVWNYVCMGALALGGMFRPIPNENILYAENLLAALHLDHRMKHPVGRLSPGQQQGVRLARAMISLPKLLILDEPFQSLDPQGRELAIRLLNDFRRRINTTILIASQDGKSLAPFCKHVACLNHSLLWTCARKRISDEVWDDPCRIFPSQDEVVEEEFEPQAARAEYRPRHSAANHAIQFWR